MKLIFKPIFFILKIIAVIVVILLIFLGLMYKSVTPPTFDANNGFEASELLTEKADELIDEENTDKIVSIELSTENTNNEIKKALLKNFVPDSTGDYIFEQAGVKVQGVWVNYKEDIIEVTVGAHYDAKVMTFKTRVLLSFKVTHESNEIVLKLNSVKIGNLGITWLLKLAPSLINKIGGLDVNEMINDVVKDVGTFDSEKMEVTVEIDKILETAKITDPLLESIINLVIEEEFINLKLGTDNLAINLDFKKLENLDVLESLLESKRIKTDAEFKQFMAMKMLKAAIYSGSAKPEIKFNQEELLKVIDYLILGKEDKDLIAEQKIYEIYDLVIGKPFVEIKDSKTTIMLPLSFGKDGQSFKTIVKLNTTFNKVNDDLVISFTSGIIGELEIDEELLNILLKTASMESLVINNFFVDVTLGNSSVESIEIIDDKLVIKWEAENKSEDLLLTIEEDTTLPQELKDIVTDILNNIDNDLPFEDKIDELSNYLLNVADEATLNDIMDIINNTYLG